MLIGEQNWRLYEAITPAWDGNIVDGVSGDIYYNRGTDYEADFIDCRLWTGVAENSAEYCKKGEIIMAETKKKATTKKTTTKKTTKSAPKKTTTKKAPAKKTVKKVTPKTEVKNVSAETTRLTNEARFSVWVDVLILIFIVLMFAVILYGYIIAK